ncbi:MAG: M4 family metallopeptidase [Pseudomonadota bacterium]
MNIRKSLLAAALAAWPLLPAGAAAPLMNGPALQTPQARAALAAQLALQRPLHGLDADHDYSFSVQHPGEQGTQVTRADHTYKGVRVFGSESVIVANAAGKILSESVAERRQFLGKGAANRLGALTADFSVKPAIGPKEAIEAAVRSVAQGGVPVAPPRAELIVYPLVSSERLPSAANKPEEELNALDVADVVQGYELAYLVRTRMRVGQQPVYHDTIISANDARIIDQWKALQTVIGSGKSQYNGVVPLSTTQEGKVFKLIDPLRGSGGKFGAMAITNADHGSDAGEVFTNTVNDWGDGKQYIEGGSTTDANGQTAAVNALWGLMNTYDTFKNVLGWHALDGQNTATYIAAHVNTAYDNAYYSDVCKCMFIGDGASFNSLGAIDVVGHEMGHGVTAATSSLIYFGESGGLNESSSDITGEVVEAYARAGGVGDTIPSTGNDWVLGKEISKNATPLRYMYKPSRDSSSPDAWSSTLKRLDVHYSSGPNNRMFYFLSQGSSEDKASDHHSKYLVKKPLAMSGIGSDKAYRIWFKAATTKFTAITNYKDARAKMVLAAQELYGQTSKESVAVQRAYAAINVGADVDE